jgi:hypothetical protein
VLKSLVYIDHILVNLIYLSYWINPDRYDGSVRGLANFMNFGREPEPEALNSLDSTGIDQVLVKLVYLCTRLCELYELGKFRSGEPEALKSLVLLTKF